MTLQKHDLLNELPDNRDTIHTLKMNNAHFARLFDQYHTTDHDVHRIESGAENTSDAYLETRKLERLHLKDQLYRMIMDFEQAGA